MIKRRFHITTTASRKRTRINPKLNRIRKQREKAEMYSDMMSDTQLAQPPQLHVHGDIAFDPFRDEAVLAMGNIGGGEMGIIWRRMVKYLVGTESRLPLTPPFMSKSLRNIVAFLNNKTLDEI